MGSGKKQTIGYHYRWAQHLVWCRAADALLEYRAGGATAWSGRIETNTTININQPELWGGEKGEGGVVGDLEVLFGGPDQAPSGYLSSVFGPKQSGNRGVVSTIFRGGRFGAFVPNPKPVSAKWERIFADWKDDEVWYPEKARVQVVAPGTPDEGTPTISGAWTVPAGAVVGNQGNDYLVLEDAFVGTAEDIGRLCIDARNAAEPSNYTFGGAYVYPSGDGLDIGAYSVELGNTIGIAAVRAIPTCPAGYVASVQPGDGETPLGVSDPAVACAWAPPGVQAMNPAHLIYDAATHPDMKGDPVGLIDDESLRAAADLFYSERVGLCATYDSDRETPEQFIQRICNVVGANFVFDRRVGRWFLDPIREISDPSTLPVIGESDIDMRAFDARPAVITEAVNCVRVEWRDREKNEVRLTSPVYAMGSIRSAGEVIPEIRQYHEVPTEEMALRFAQRDLTALSTPVVRFELPLLRPRRDIRFGAGFRLELPSRGIVSTVCRLGQIKEGTHTSSRTVIVAVQVATSLPDTVHVQPSPGDWVPPSTVPLPPIGPVVIEAPYVELASALPNSELAALLPDAGFLLTAAAPPPSGLNYAIYSATGAEELESRATADFSPSAVAAGSYGPDDIAIAVEQEALLDRAAIGTWVIWDEEICRLDAKDAGAVTLGRGCADTVAALHLAGSRLYFCGDWVGSDQREYVDGEVVRARLLTRTSSGELPISAAPELTVSMAGRQARPYPPGDVRINGAAWPETLFGPLALTGVHRDRILQSDQLVDQTQGDVGPEPGTSYSVRWYVDDVLEREQTGLDAPEDDWTPTSEGVVRVEVEAVRDGLASWQAQVRTFSWTEDEVFPRVRVTDAPATRVTDGGGRRITE